VRRPGRLGWYAGTVVVFAVALLPVLWIVSLSPRSPATITDKGVAGRPDAENYRRIFSSALFTWVPLNWSARPITTVLAVALATPAAYALTCRGSGARRCAAAPWPSPCSRRWHWSPLFDMWRARLYDTWPGLVIPYLSLRAAAGMGR
jgi:multiple sugar transport system permease protein